MLKIVNMKPRLGMTYVSYCYGKLEPSDDEYEHCIDRVVVDGDAKLVKLVNQYMKPCAPEVKVVSMDDQYRCNDWVNSHRHSGLLVDELEIEKRFRGKSECVNAVKRWHIKNSLQ
jgi:hypothetical protein